MLGFMPCRQDNPDELTDNIAMPSKGCPAGSAGTPRRRGYGGRGGAGGEAAAPQIRRHIRGRQGGGHRLPQDNHSERQSTSKPRFFMQRFEDTTLALLPYTIPVLLERLELREGSK
eukprot:scaffold328523_cov28-Prasinocladus_malaysianus.AAC.1